jgi:heme oxygenase
MMKPRSSGIIARLREETRTEHEAIELALDWQTRAASRERYARWLARMHGFHQRWEPAIASALSNPEFFDPRRKLHLLDQDLRTLGLDEPGALHPRLSAITFATQAEALGSLYVLEGSTLGGQLIARHVRSSLGFEPAYHGSYGSRTGEMWRSFRQHLEEQIAPGDEDSTIAAAAKTFHDLRVWLTASD